MDSYYHSLLNEIHKLMDASSFQNAYDLIHQELQMPYVPKEVLEVLQADAQECQMHLQPKHALMSEEISDLVQGSTAKKELAVSYLLNMNLRFYTEEVQMLLESEILDEYKGELIEALMAQKIDTPFQISKSGLQITFVPSAILTKDEDPTWNETQKILDFWLSNDNPAFYNFCIRLMEQELLEMRPFDFEGIDPTGLAKSIVYLVMEAFGQTDEFVTFEKGWGLQEVEKVPLLIERRKDENDK